MADKSEWKTPSMEGEEKGDVHHYGRKSRTPEPIPIAGKLTYSEEKMGHWTPTGIKPRNYEDDELLLWQDFSSPKFKILLTKIIEIRHTFRSHCESISQSFNQLFVY